jgi:quercetin dioxygenase-like cupin family protein
LRFVAETVLDLRRVFGLRARITTPAEATGGAYVEMDVTADPGAATMLHIHPTQQETYRVLSGTLDVFRDGKWNRVGEGESFIVPPGTVHGFRVTGDSPVRFVNGHAPALGFQDHLVTLDRLVRAGQIRSTKDIRSLIYMSMSAVKHRPDVPVKPPLFVLKALALIGRVLRYKLDG